MKKDLYRGVRRAVRKVKRYKMKGKAAALYLKMARRRVRGAAQPKRTK